jgi:YfiH family protein
MDSEGTGTVHGGWSIVDSLGLRVARCGLLELPGLGHAFSTREIDLGGAGEPDPARIADRQRLARSAGVLGTPTVVRQVHGRSIVGAGEVGRETEADGVIATAGEVGSPPAAVRVADCVPVLLACRSGRVVAAVHAGWRGTAAGIVGCAVRRFGDLGVPPGELRAALGPAIGGCCYEVGPEVVRGVAGATAGGSDHFTGKSPSGGTHVDLRGANRIQLESAGLAPGSISIAPWCTACHGELFFSYRREGAGAGRMMALIGWGPSP